MKKIYTYEIIAGKISLAEEAGALTNLWLPGEEPEYKPDILQETALLTKAAAQLQEYFLGQRQKFTIPLLPAGTPFQLSVWQELQRIEYGQCISYGMLANRLGRPGASRAVGGANHRNPLPIFIPCHRVIAADGKMCGFRAGLWWKESLLALEKGARNYFVNWARTQLHP